MTKNSYAQFTDVRAYPDKKTGDIHLTIKDPRLKDGFKLTLNSGRKEELSLRAILEAEDKMVPMPESNLPHRASYDYHIPNLKSAPQEGEFEGYSYKEVSTALKKITDGSHIPLGATSARRFDNVFWDVNVDTHLLVAAGRKSGLITFLRSIVNFTSTYSDQWQCFVIDGGNDKIHNDESQNFTEISKITDALMELYLLSDPETQNEASGKLKFENKQTIVIISNIDRLKPTNPNSWEEIIQYEKLLNLVRLMENVPTKYRGTHVVLASENFTTDYIESIKPSKYTRRMVIGKVPLEVSEFALGEGNDAGVRIPRIPGRAITIRHQTVTQRYHADGDNTTAKDETQQEIQAFDLSNN